MTKVEILELYLSDLNNLGKTSSAQQARIAMIEKELKIIEETAGTVVEMYDWELKLVQTCLRSCRLKITLNRKPDTFDKNMERATKSIDEALRKHRCNFK